MMPKKITAGDTIEWLLTAPEAIDTTTHKLYVAIRGNVPITLDGQLIQGTANFKFDLDGESSSELKAGRHYYQIYSDLIDTTSSDKTTLSTDYIVVTPSFVDADDEQDLRTHDEKQLDAINQIITKRLSGDDATEEYSTVGGRSIRKATLKELYEIRKEIEQRIRLMIKARNNSSLEQLYVRFK